MIIKTAGNKNQLFFLLLLLFKGSRTMQYFTGNAMNGA